MLYSRHFSLSWFTACMRSVVEYLLLNPPFTLGWFSSSFFSSLVVMIFVNSLYIFDSKQIGLWFLMSFMFPFLKHITIFASFHVLGMHRSVMHFVYSFTSCFTMVSGPAFSVSMLTWSFPASFPFFIFLSAASTSHAIIGVLLRGLFVLLQIGRCYIILSRIILFVPWSYLVLGSLCLVCPVVLSSAFS